MTKEEFVFKVSRYNGTTKLISVVSLFRFSEKELGHLFSIIKTQRELKKEFIKEAIR